MRAAIRDETVADHSSIRAVVTAAFGRGLEAELVERLRADGDAAISLVACADRDVIGHVLFWPMRAPFRALGLGPLAVLPARQRAGVGSSLIRAGLARAAASGWEAIFVLGEPAFYGRFGFDAELARGFDSQYAGPFFLVMPLSGTLSATSGRVEYALAFAALS